MMALSYYLTIVNIANKNLIFFADMNGTLFTIFTMLFSLLISVLFGLYIALFFFKIDIAVATSNAVGNTSGFGGATIAALASGCPSCGAPLLGLFGFPLGLFALPLRGIEIKILSVALLIVSLYLIINNIKNSLACEKK